MSTSRTPPQAFPAVPPSLNPEDHELRHYYHDNSVPPPAHTIPYYTPYLGLRARLSQVWINRWTILLALVLCRILLAVQDINYDIARAKEEALSACTSVENIGSAMASMPHYMSEGVNALAADGVTKAFQGLMEMLTLTVTGVEEIILFIINMYKSTYFCLITLAITGSLHVAIEMIEKVGDFMNQTIKGITGDLSSVATDFESGLNDFLKGLSIPASIFGASSPPTIDLSKQINELNSITIDPTTMDADLTKLNNSIPTFEQVQNLTDNVIRTPFEFVKQAINDSVTNYTFDSTIFAVAPKQALTFCSDNTAINDFFDGLAKVVKMAQKVFIIVIILMAVLVCIPMAYREIWRWRTLKQRSQLVAKNAYDPMDVIYMASRPYTSTAGIKAATAFTKTKDVILTRWFVAYATTTPALFVLALGIAGLFTNLCQFIVLKIIEKEVPALADEVGDFAKEVVTALNNASESWAVAANGVISSTNTRVNNDVFGWVNTSTTAVNNTLNTFVDEMSKELNATFGGTILYDPITEVINCLIGLKIAGIESALTWVHDNAHVTFPEFRSDIFSLGAAASLTNSSTTESFLSSPGDVSGDDITNAIVKMSDKLQQQIRTEVIISSTLVACWVLIVLIGLFSALFMKMVRDKTRAEGGAVRFTGDNRSPPITPRGRGDESRFPEFGGPVSSVHPQFSNDNMYATGEIDEKFGSAGHHSVEASYKPGHERTSSYGYVEANEKR